MGRSARSAVKNSERREEGEDEVVREGGAAVQDLVDVGPHALPEFDDRHTAEPPCRFHPAALSSSQRWADSTWRPLGQYEPPRRSAVQREPEALPSTALPPPHRQWFACPDSSSSPCPLVRMGHRDSSNHFLQQLLLVRRRQHDQLPRASPPDVDVMTSMVLTGAPGGSGTPRFAPRSRAGQGRRRCPSNTPAPTGSPLLLSRLPLQSRPARPVGETATRSGSGETSVRFSVSTASGDCNRRQTIRMAAMTGTDKNIPATPAISPPAITPKITSAGWISMPRAMTRGLIP